MPLAHPSKQCVGFTLVEMLVVVVILGIVAAVTMPQIRESTRASKEANILSNLATMRQAIELYKVQHDDTWPGSQIVSQLLGKTDIDGTLGTRFGPYLRGSIPMNPLSERNDVDIFRSMPAKPGGPQGWRYAVRTGEIRLNSGGVGPSGIAYYDM